MIERHIRTITADPDGLINFDTAGSVLESIAQEFDTMREHAASVDPTPPSPPKPEAESKPDAQTQSEVGEDWLPEGLPRYFGDALCKIAVERYNAGWRAEVRRLRTERLDMRQHAQEWEEEATRLRSQLAAMTERAEAAEKTTNALRAKHEPPEWKITHEQSTTTGL